MKSYSKFTHFHSRKCIWKYRLENGGHKNIERHTVDTIVSWSNPKQWVIVHSSDLMMIIRQIIYTLSIMLSQAQCVKADVGYAFICSVLRQSQPLCQTVINGSSLAFNCTHGTHRLMFPIPMSPWWAHGGCLDRAAIGISLYCCRNQM